MPPYCLHCISASGTVYLATDSRTRNQVAIKMSAASDLENLKHEIALQRLSKHDNIVKYFETYMKGGNLWVCICMCEAATFPALVVLIPTAYLPTNLAAHVFRLC